MTLLHASMHAGEIGWPHLLNSINVDYPTLRYRDIAMGLGERATRGRLRWRGLPDASMAATPALRRQADATTERFVEEWQRVTGGCAACEDDSEGVTSSSSYPGESLVVPNLTVLIRSIKPVVLGSSAIAGSGSGMGAEPRLGVPAELES